ncbi:AAA-like domain-containing protein [Clostridium ljungdahlii]|uniref:Putative AAA-ATPase n=1 Tax=Clostridium ljungdahlii TaxID=1538 RepID=A0A168Q3T1_9CLOT|nr:AAA-like domain-containing protein [Clostridium ljungdahlii]OAA88605.1 putative AAA-ATPase [Clostridium ljungdahlii]
MEKEFNVTGTCIPEMHYMVDTSNKLKKVIRLIDKGKYFIINRPRQYGKTTTLFLLEKTLNKNEDYFVISISFEGIGDLIFEDETKFSKGFLNILKRTVELEDLEIAAFINEEKENVENLDDLSSFITRLVKNINKKVILMIDEVDKSSNNQLFLSFLGMLRNKYLLRNMGKDYTFYSVILAGVHDVKTLKVKIRPDEEHKYNSPWNIASDFDVDMSFSSKEIETMMDDYVEDKNVELDKEYFSERLYYYTSGYPFLVSKLCKIIDEKIMDEDRLVWDKDYMDLAVKKILMESNTNFDSLIKNIENNDELKNLVKRIILDNDEVTYVADNPVINMGIIYGIFKNENGKIKINNRVYEQRIYNYMSSLVEISVNIGYYNQKSGYIKQDGELDVRRILIKFSEFMKHEYSEKRQAFLEADGRLLFLAFINPIINGTGFAFKEVQGGEEKRFDIVITYNKKMYILELKRWNGEEYHQKGLVQLGEYLEQYGLDEGYLLIFDFRKLNNELGKLKEAAVTIGDRKKNIVEVYC